MARLFICFIVLGLSSTAFAETILEYLQSKPANFTYAVQAIKIANLTSEFQTGGPFTAFIPTDSAFQKIPAPILSNLLNNPTAIRSLLLKHVTNGALISPFIKTGTNETSLGGTTLELTKDSNGKIMVNGVAVVTPDVIVSNGVVQAIDYVFNVPAASVNMIEYLLKDKQFRDLTAALTITNLTSTLEGPGPFTLFAPTDAAFSAIGSSLQGILGNTKLFTEILLHHVVSGTVYASSLVNGQNVTTLAGKTFVVTKNGPSVTLDHSHVIKPDVPVLNGLIHVVDAIIVPS